MKRTAIAIPLLALGLCELPELYAQTQDARPTSSVVKRRVWKLPAGMQSMPMGPVSPDGRYFAGGGSRLRVFDLATQDTRTITGTGLSLARNAAGFGTPTPSPDGNWLAYLRITHSDSLAAMRVIRLDGSGERQVWRNRSVEILYPQSWSPDGSQIAGHLARREDRTSQLVVVDNADGSVRVLKSAPDWRAPAGIQYSPDGRFIAYASLPDGEKPVRDGAFLMQIHVMAADGSREAIAVEPPVSRLGFSWTPDGSAITFGRDRDGGRDLWAVPMSDGRPTGPPVLVVPELRNATGMGFTRSGDFYYRVRVGQIQAHVATISGALDAGTVRAPPLVGAAVATWSPDGEYLAFTKSLSSTTITIRSAESGEERELRVHGVPYLGEQPSWAPDGRSIIAVSYDDRQRTAVIRVDAQTGEVSALTPPSSGHYVHHVSPGLSPDGSTLYYKMVDTVVAYDLGTGTSRTLFTPPPDRSTLGGIALSPDGTKLGVTYGPSAERLPNRTANTIGVVDLNGELRELVRAEEGAWFQDVMWTPDGRVLVFGKWPDPTGPIELWQVSVDGSAPVQIEFAADSPPIRGPMWGLGNFHPAGRRFTYTSQDTFTEIWVIEDLARAVRDAIGAESNQ